MQLSEDLKNILNEKLFLEQFLNEEEIKTSEVTIKADC